MSQKLLGICQPFLLSPRLHLSLTVILSYHQLIDDTKELLLMKDVIEAIEEMADKCQEVSDSFILLALSL